MALGTTNISTTLVRNTLGEDNNDVGLLCSSDQINKWSLKKPASILTPANHSPAVQVLSGGGISSGHGIYRKYPSVNEIYYARPQGGATDPYRLGDFRGYNHSATPPTQITIVQVTELNTGQILASPYKLINGFRYKIKFSLFAGEIDPETIYDATVRVKNTSAGGGYGGISLRSGVSVNQSRPSSEVFTCPSTNNEQTLLCEPQGIIVAYCQYSGSETGLYQTLEYEIEDTSYKTVIPSFYIDIAQIQTLHSFTDLGGDFQVYSRTTFTNNMGRVFNNFRVRFLYRINSGSNMTVITNSVTIASSGDTIVNSPYFNISSANPNQNNTFYCAAYLEVFDNATSQWIILRQHSTSAVIFVPNS